MWESNIANLLTKYTIRDSVALDIGQYIGTHTLVLSDAVGNRGKVYGFEPQRFAHKSILKTLKQNNIKNVVCYNSGLSDKKDKIKFCSDNTGGSKICNKNYDYYINVDKLDNYNIKNISCMKVDIEEHELHFLKGAINTIKQSKPVIIIEILNKCKDRNDILKLLKKYGYNIKRLYKTEDFLCIHKNCGNLFLK
jgi:FkbM family methyltransferase